MPFWKKKKPEPPKYQNIDYVRRSLASGVKNLEERNKQFGNVIKNVRKIAPSQKTMLNTADRTIGVARNVLKSNPARASLGAAKLAANLSFKAMRSANPLRKVLFSNGGRPLKSRKKTRKSKKQTKWMKHMMAVYTEMREKNPETKLRDAMKEAKKTYKPAQNGGKKSQRKIKSKSKRKTKFRSNIKRK